MYIIYLNNSENYSLLILCTYSILNLYYNLMNYLGQQKAPQLYNQFKTDDGIYRLS